MKLGTQTGSLTNHIISRMVKGQPNPEPGMGATILCWTDRHAATITKVWVDRRRTYVEVQEDSAVRTDRNGMSECQTYQYVANPNGHITVFRCERNGMWREVNFNVKTKRWNANAGHGLRIGDRDEYRDPTF